MLKGCHSALSKQRNLQYRVGTCYSINRKKKKRLDLKWDCTQLYLIDSKERISAAYMLPNKNVKTVYTQISNDERVPKDQAIETKCNKSTKGSSESVGCTQKEESVLKMKIICHKKREYTDNFLYSMCCFNDDSNYSLRRKFSHAITQRDKICLSQLVTYIAQ